MIPLSPEHDSTAHEIVDSAFAVHRALGPGLLESVRERYFALSVERRLKHPAVVAISEAANEMLGTAKKK